MNVEKVTNEIIEFIRDYYKKNNLKGAIIGISGGKDSAVVAGLFAKALGSENVIGIWMPCHSKDEDYLNALLVSKTFGFELKEFDLTNIYESYVRQIKEVNDVSDNELVDSNINIKPRLRMSTLYYYAAMKKGYIVPGTSNKCELYVGYFTKGGDNVCDISVLADLTVDEVIRIGEYIGVPDKVIHKVPDDGLSGKTDEEKLGVKYSDIAKVINNEEVDIETYKKIKIIHERNFHKFQIPTYKK
ncbi:MAG: NAD(+) synthase [Bacilli bacterium]|nr:NAD(+) synthase [Bacilli bacterium]